MNDWEFTFEQSPWELTLAGLEAGGVLSAARFLTLLEGEDEAAAEAALQELEDKHIALDIAELPLDPGTGSAAVRLRQEAQLVQSGQLFHGLQENDPLRLYMEELAGIPAAGEPALWAVRYLAGEEGSMQQLANSMLSRVVSMAGQMTGRGVLLLDLVQEGSLGLWQGILSYTGGDIEAHCDWWIRQYLAKAVTLQARAGGVGQKLRRQMEDYRDVDQRLLSELGRSPTLEEIAEPLHIPVEEAAVLEKMLQAARTVERIKADQEPKEPTPEDDQAVEDTAYFQSRQRILELLSALEERDAKLLSLRFGLEGGIPMDPGQVGRKLGLTAEEVVQREAAALTKLRQQGE